ncbi:hypothetical protein QJS10_CPA10g01372 [Acorus calamus]|uniref:Uncharacterized protein n=1 Tax=Acorus calamus TaxID=4465 RepID=A0AAV9DZV6_ACOCL|nr:hypothetical protein QJS10_CPA10g01372 [Acorus calamus]
MPPGYPSSPSLSLKAAVETRRNQKRSSMELSERHLTRPSNHHHHYQKNKKTNLHHHLRRLQNKKYRDESLNRHRSEARTPNQRDPKAPPPPEPPPARPSRPPHNIIPNGRARPPHPPPTTAPPATAAETDEEGRWRRQRRPRDDDDDGEICGDGSYCGAPTEDGKVIELVVAGMAGRFLGWGFHKYKLLD